MARLLEGCIKGRVDAESVKKALDQVQAGAEAAGDE